MLTALSLLITFSVANHCYCSKKVSQKRFLFFGHSCELILQFGYQSPGFSVTFLEISRFTEFGRSGGVQRKKEINL